MNSTPVFTNPQEETDYWKNKAVVLEKEVHEVQAEYDDFQTSSRELESEMEAQLNQLESRNKELASTSEKLTMERDHYRERLEGKQVTLSAEVTDLQDQLTSLSRDKDQLQRAVRHLEQVNDDLERSKRAAVATLEDFKTQLDDAIEQNALLENELEGREDLEVTIQRLKDEVRDLQQELTVTRKHQPPQPPSPTAAFESAFGSHALNGMSCENSSPRALDFAGQTESSPMTNGGVFNKPVRMAALGMVNEALAKIARLESRLTTLYRAYGSSSLATPSLSHFPFVNSSEIPNSSNDHHHQLHRSEQSVARLIPASGGGPFQTPGAASVWQRSSNGAAASS